MKYLSKSNIKYVLVRDNSKGAKALYDIYDAKDTKSGVHYAEGGLTDSVYKLKSQTIVIDDKGKVVDEKMNGIWLKKNAKPIGSIKKSEIDNMKSLQDWKDHIEGKSKSGDSGLSLNPTRVYKNFYGWVAKTTTKEPIGGYDYEITTMKRYDKTLVSDAQGGKRKSGGAGGFDTFEFAVFQSPSFLLVETKPKVVNEKRIREQHEEAIEKFKYLYKEGKLTKKKEYAHGGMTDSKKDISRVVLSDDNEKVFVDTPSMVQANEVLYGIWNSNKYSDVYYDITFEDGKEISGSIDLEPHSFHKGHEKKILTWHLLTFYNNLAKLSSLNYIYGETTVEDAKDLVKNYKLYAKGGSVDAYVPVSKKITTQEINDFVDYVEGFYGKKGFYADELDGGFTKKQIKDAVNKYLKDLDRNPTWGDGDSTDRERVRQYLQPEYMLFAKGGGVDDDLEWVVEYLMPTEDNYRVEKGFESEEQARRWVKGERIDKEAEDISIHPIKKFAKGGGVGKYEIFRVNEFLYNFEPKEFDKPRGKTIYRVYDEDDDGEEVVEGYDNYDEAISAHSRSKLKGYPIFWRTELETKKPPYVYESGVVLSDGRLVVKRRRGIEVDEYAKGGMTFGGKMHGAGMFGYGGEFDDESDPFGDEDYLSDSYDTRGVNREDLQTLLNLIDSHDISYDYQPTSERLYFDMSELNREEQEFAKNILKLNM